jgi:hypothetical protein
MRIYFWVYVMIGFGRKYLRQVCPIHRDLENTLVFEVWSACKHSQYCNPHVSPFRGLWSQPSFLNVFTVIWLKCLLRFLSFFLASSQHIKNTEIQVQNFRHHTVISKKHVTDSCMQLSFFLQLFASLRPFNVSHFLINFFHPSQKCYMRTAQPKSFSITQPFLAPFSSGIPASKVFTLQKDLELFVKNRNGFFMSASRGHRTVQNIGILESSHHSTHQRLVIVNTLTLTSLLQYIIYS